MAVGIYYMVVVFDRNRDGTLTIREAREVEREDSARKRALTFGKAFAGAIAFSRTGDPMTGEFGEPEIIVTVGDVDLATEFRTWPSTRAGR